MDRSGSPTNASSMDVVRSPVRRNYRYLVSAFSRPCLDQPAAVLAVLHGRCDGPSGRRFLVGRDSHSTAARCGPASSRPQARWTFRLAAPAATTSGRRLTHTLATGSDITAKWSRSIDAVPHRQTSAKPTPRLFQPRRATRASTGPGRWTVYKRVSTSRFSGWGQQATHRPPTIFPFFFLGLFFLVSLVRVSHLSSHHHHRLFCQHFLSFFFGFLLGIKSRGPYKHFIFLVFSDFGYRQQQLPLRARPHLQLTCLESSHQVCDPVAHHSFSNLLSAPSNCSVSETTVPSSNRHQETPFARDHHLASFRHGVSSTKAGCHGHDLYCHAGMPTCVPHRHHWHGCQFHQRDRCRRTQSPL